jgi:DNA ligase (NAD+)
MLTKLSAKDAVSDLPLAELQHLIDKADLSYYRVGYEPILTDEEYDALRPALKVKNPEDSRIDRVGVPYSPEELRSKVKHPIPMGSLDNTDDGILGLDAWIDWVRAKLNTDTKVMASLKMDGGSMRAKYVDGVLTEVATRGNGEVGENITLNAAAFRDLPTVLDKPVNMDVRGEAILHKSDFKAICVRDHGKPFEEIDTREISNPRNVGNGLLGRDDGQDSDKMRFYVFNVEFWDGHEDFEFETEAEKFKMLKGLGFQVVPHELCKDVDAIKAFYNKTANGRDKFPFEIDGVVITLDSVENQEFFITKDVKTRLRPKYARAIKFPHRAAVTTLESVSLSVGHTRAIIPTANLTEVRVGGVNVTHALLNNFDEIRRLDIAVGDEVEVVLAGDIIPKVIRKVKTGSSRHLIYEPEHCPACGSTTTRVHRGKPGAVTYCSNSHCAPAMLAKIDHWIGGSKKGVGILGIGDGILKAMWDEKLVSDPADLYTLTVEQLESLTMDGVRVGNSRAQSIIGEIQSKKEIPLDTFLGSLGIDLLGRRRVKILQQSAEGKLDRLENWLDTETFKQLEIQGLGDTTKGAVISGIENCRGLIEKLFANGVSIKYEDKVEVSDGAIFDGFTFCLTGTRECIDDIERLGGTLKSGVSKTLSYLVQKDPTSQSGKTKKADSYGIPVIALDYLKRAIAGEVVLDGKKMDPAEAVNKAKSTNSASPEPKPKQVSVNTDALVDEIFE